MKNQWVATKSRLTTEIGLVQNRPAIQHFAYNLVKQLSKIIPTNSTEFNKKNS